MGLFEVFRKAGPAGAPRPGIDAPSRRRSERLDTAVLSCLLGEVKDLSTTGMRIVGRQAPPVPLGMLFEFDLHGPSDTVTIVGRIVRVRKLKSSGVDVGIEFHRLTPELTAALESLARHGVIKGVKPGAGSTRLTARVELPDLYELLGLAPTATDADIQHAFRAKARECHPDLNKSPESQSRFVQLHKAYDVLKDPDKRREYDAAMLKSRAA